MNPLAGTPDGSVRSFAHSNDAVSRKFVLVFIGLAACIIAAGTFYYRDYERKFRIEIEHQLSTIADLKVSQLVQWRKERMSDAGVLFQNPSLSALVRRFLEKPAAARNPHP